MRFVKERLLQTDKSMNPIIFEHNAIKKMNWDVILMEELYNHFNDESTVDDRFAQLNYETLKACEIILENPNQHSARTLAFAKETKSQITNS